ncbi:MAG TPA: zf-HC2 domain-containing protein [Candidatus Methylomirabilis sp.]|nr:zf-HC2 domain-containing protein [Candidatus Methylomirabilis sp.]
MNCPDARAQLLDYQRGRLAPQARGEVHAHLESCPACAREDSTERALTELLEERTPLHAAPLGLKRRLAARWPETPGVEPSWWIRWGRPILPALAVAAVLLVLVPLYYQDSGTRPTMVTEAANDHLRILSSQHPLDIESGGMHQVKPWFEGRLEFAPVLGFMGDEEFPLQGGAVGYFLDRKAAVFVFHRRLHAISLFVFRADGLPWPRGIDRGGRSESRVMVSRGFNVILWRSGELGYALVSDLDRRELSQLANKLAG